MVTMSNFILPRSSRRIALRSNSTLLLIQLQQSLGRVDSNPPARDIHLDANIGSKGNQHLPPRPLHTQHAGPGAPPSTRLTSPTRSPDVVSTAHPTRSCT